MRKLKPVKSRNIISVLPVLISLLSACSSGGSIGTSGASYSGVSTQATITSSNAESLAESMMDGASGSNAAASATSGPEEDKEQLLKAVRSIHSIVKNSDKQKISSDTQSSATVYNAAQEVTSDCGGTLSYTFTYDDVTGKFSGSYTFSSYVDCNDHSTMNGSMTISGSLKLTTLELTSMTATFSSLSYKDANEAMTMNGEMIFSTLTSTSYKTTMNMDFTDNAKNSTYRVENYVAIITEDAKSTYADLDISGKFYHPDYGYVTLTTTTVLHIVYPDENPRSGVIELAGSSGSKAVITMTSNDTYTLQIDANGDATYETTKSCTWSTSTCI